MNRLETLARTAVFLVVSALVANAGFDVPNRITTSSVQEKTATSIVVGRLIAYHQLPPETGNVAADENGRTLYRYVAEVEVTSVEKGLGIARGSVIRVGFGSQLTK